MIELIPAIDIIDGKCVRLTKGDYGSKKVYDDNPVDVAKRFEQLGFKRLHVVDLDGAKSHHIVNDKVLRDITNSTQLTVDFGGGLKTRDDLTKALDAGADLVTVGSVAVAHPEIFIEWLGEFGSEHLILGADARNGYVSINGWLEDSTQQLIPFLRKYVEAGVKNVLCTDIDKDGMMQGPSTELYKDVMREFPDIHLIASGGISSDQDILKLEQEGIPAVVFGKAFYEGKIDIKTLMKR